MSSIVISNNEYINKWGILKACIKNNVLHYNNINNINEIKEIDNENIVRLGLLWDNFGDTCEIPFFNSIKIPKFKCNFKKTKKINMEKNKHDNVTCKIRYCKRYFNITRKRGFISKKHTRCSSDVKKQPLEIIDALKDWSRYKSVNTKHLDIVNKYKQYANRKFKNLEHKFKKVFYTKELLDLFINISKGKKDFVVDLITCNMNDPLFISQTKLIEKKLNITIRFSYDKTGNKKLNMSNWIQESHNVSIKSLYFNSFIDRWDYVLSATFSTPISDDGDYNLKYYVDSNETYITGLNTINRTLTEIPNIYISGIQKQVFGFESFNFKNNISEDISLIGINFNGLTFKTCDISGIELKDCDLSSSILIDCSLTNLLINNTKFGFINESGNIFTHNNNEKYFSRINKINNTRKRITYFLGKGVNLSYVDISDQNLDNINFTNSNLTDTYLPSRNINNTRFVNFKGTPYNLPSSSYNQIEISTDNNIIIGPNLDITNCNLSNKDLTGFNLTNCSLENVYLTNTVMTDVIINNTIAGPILYTSNPIVPNDYSIMVNNVNSKYLLGSNVKIHNVNFDNYHFNNMKITNIDLSKCNLSNVSFTNSYIHMIKNNYPTSLPNDYVVLGQNILGSGLLFGPGIYDNVDFVGFNLAGHNISTANFINCKIANLTNSNAVPILNNINQYLLTFVDTDNITKHSVYGENFNCTDFNFTDVDLTNKSLVNSNLENAKFTNAIFNNTRLYNINGIPQELPNDYVFDTVNKIVFGPNLNYENMIISNNNLFKTSFGYRNINGISSKNITWNDYDLSNNYNVTTDTNRLLPKETKFVDGMIINKDANLKNTKVIRLKRNVELKKSVKYTFKSIVKIESPFTMKLDYTTSRTDISFVYNSTNEHPVQFLNETSIDLSGVSEETKNQFDLSYVIHIGQPDYSGRNLSDVNLDTVDISNSNLTGSTLNKANLENKDLTGSILKDTSLEEADLSGTNLTNTDFTGATIENMNLSYSENLETAIFSTSSDGATVIIEDHTNQTLPANVTFTPGPTYEADGKGTLSVTNIQPIQELVLYDVSYLDIEPGSVNHLDFSFNNTQYNSSDLTIEIISEGTHGSLNKTQYNINNKMRYSANNTATGSDVITWRVSYPNGLSVGYTNEAKIYLTYKLPPSNNAIIESITKTTEVGSALNITLTGRYVNFFEFVSLPQYGSLQFDGKNINKNTRIPIGSHITYTGSSTNTEILSYRAFGESNLYSATKTLTIEVIEALITNTKIDSITSKFNELTASILSLLDGDETAVPSLVIGDMLLFTDGVALNRGQKKTARDRFLKMVFTTFISLKRVRMLKSELGLSSKMLGMFKNNVVVVDPDPENPIEMPDLSQESLYCDMNDGDTTKMSLNGQVYTFTQYESYTEVYPAIHGKTVWTSDETTVLGNTVLIFGSLGAGENDAPIFTSSIPTESDRNIEIGDQFTYNITYEDANDDPLTLTATSLPDWLTLSVDNTNNTAILQGTAQINDAGNNSVELSLTDGGSTVTQSFSIFVAIPKLIIKELGDTDTLWGNIPGKSSMTYQTGSRYIMIENRDTISVNLSYYKLKVHGTTNISGIYRFNNNSDFIQLSGTLASNKHALITINSGRNTTNGNNFEITFGETEFTDVVDIIYNFNNLTNTTLYGGLTGHESLDLIVNNGNNGDYLVDRFGIEPINNNINTLDWENKVLQRKTSVIEPTQTFDLTNEWTTYDIASNNSLTIPTAGQDSIFTFMNLIPSAVTKVSGYYPLYNAHIYAYNHSGGNQTITEYVLNNKTYFMPNGVTQYLGTYDDAIVINGYYPLYLNVDAANNNSPTNSNHAHIFDSITYYMPDGLVLGSTFFHGTYNDPFYLEGYYPLYRVEDDAIAASTGTPKSAVSQTVSNVTYYMPYGLPHYLGTYDDVFSHNGYYPLYHTEEYANANSPSNTSHSHTFGEVTYYMPNGVTYYHGNYVETNTTPPCLTKESMVKTPNGYINITKLQKYDYVVTSDNRTVPITKISVDRIKTDKFNTPYIIPKNYFGKNYPSKSFKISPQHAIAINKKASEWFIPYINGNELERYKEHEIIDYYHIELPNWMSDHLVINNGVVVESLAESYHKKLKINNTMYIEKCSGYFERDNKYYAKKRSEYRRSKLVKNI